MLGNIYTIQEAFDTVIKHMATQNKQSIDYEGTCMYRGISTLMCAIGCLINDKYYREALESKNVGDSEVLDAVHKSGYPTDAASIDMYVMLQSVHDSHKTFIGNITVIETVRIIALKYSLNEHCIGALEINNRG